jgi:hypothetical protein
MRRWLLILLCLGMSLQAWARLPTAPSPCPMSGLVTGSSAEEALNEPADHDGLPDCCQDLAQCLQSGLNCAGGYGPGGMAWGLYPGPARTLAAGPGVRPPPHGSPARAPMEPDCIWRPPALA